jgi:two-component system, oxyanion-binding sensor
VPASHHAAFPWVSHAFWIYDQMIRWRQVEFATEHTAVVRSTYRPDLYRSALTNLDTDTPATDLKVERFFDGGSFDCTKFVR